MAPSKMRRAIGAVKDQTSIGLAKVGSSNSLSDLDVAIVKATRHEENPAEERHVREILSLTSYSRAYISACVNTLSRRLNKTRNWTVALKTLVLIQRLIAEGDPAYEQEIFFATRRGTRLLNMCDFCDASRSNSWDYSAFVRTYALYLDERLEFRMQGRRGRRSAFGLDDEDDEDGARGGTTFARSTPIREMKTHNIFSRIQHLQQLLERFLACRPTGGAKHNRVVMAALYPIVKESFQLYYDITEILGILIDRFMELAVPDSIKVYDIFCRISKQFDELDNFYGWCKTLGIARSSEYPEVEKITHKKLDLMDEFIRDKSALAQTSRNIPNEETPIIEQDFRLEYKAHKDNMNNAIGDLQAQENYTEDLSKQEVHQEPKEDGDKQEKNLVEVDLLNLGNDAVSVEDHANQLALALFDGSTTPQTTTTLGWEAFNDATLDWETTLVQSTSNLSNRKTNLAGGFDMLLLEGMYQQRPTNAMMSPLGYAANGSDSSVVLDSARKPAMLALPAPSTPNANNTALSNVDPFAASFTIAPPSYVQISDMEKKQKLLMEEQIMWKQYAKDGMQGQFGLSNLQHNSYTGRY